MTVTDWDSRAKFPHEAGETTCWISHRPKFLVASALTKHLWPPPSTRFYDRNLDLIVQDPRLTALGLLTKK
jgi:hypothetical protein